MIYPKITKKALTLKSMLLKYVLNRCYFTFISSTSKISVASGGITPPAP